MRPLTIDLDRLALAMNRPDQHFFLDLLSGQLRDALADDALAAQLLDEPERFLEIEPFEEAAAQRLMSEFLADVDDPHAYAVLNHALAGRKPVRAFLHGLSGYPELRRAWQAYESSRRRELAADWLEEHELEAQPPTLHAPAPTAPRNPFA